MVLGQPRGMAMPFLKLISETPELSLAPEDVTALGAAYDLAILNLGLVDRDDPLTKLVAERLINLARQGQRDPHKLRDAVLSSLK